MVTVPGTQYQVGVTGSPCHCQRHQYSFLRLNSDTCPSRRVLSPAGPGHLPLAPCNGQQEASSPLCTQSRGATLSTSANKTLACDWAQLARSPWDSSAAFTATMLVGLVTREKASQPQVLQSLV